MSTLNKIEPLENLSLVDKAEIRILKFFKENNLKPGMPFQRNWNFPKLLGLVEQLCGKLSCV